MSWGPRKLTKRPGFTLLEVTIAIVLIAMILVTTIMAFGGTVNNTFWLRKYSQNSFLNQQAMEERITEVKQKGGDLSYGSLFGKTVEGYLIAEAMEGTGKELKTFVVQDQTPELLLPNVDVVVNRGQPYLYLNETAGPMDYYISGPTDDLSLWYTQWFAADRYLVEDGIQRDFSMPLLFSYDGGATSTEDLYPTYPNHFSPTRIVGDRLTVGNDYLNRHLVYHVQPVGNYGITGLGNQSTYIYVMGVPVMAGLRYHFDMNFFAKTDGSNVGLGEIVNVTSIQDLYNGGNDKRPQAITVSTQGSNSIRRVSKQILLLDQGRLERNQKLLRLNNAYADLTSSSAVTVFMNFYYEGSQGILFGEVPVTSGTQNRWSVRIAEDGRIQLWLTTGSWTAVSKVFESEPLAMDTMHNVSLIVQGGACRLRVDGEEATQLIPNFSAYSTSRVKRIGGTGEIQLAEALVYHAVLNETNFFRVEQYMLDKNRAGN